MPFEEDVMKKIILISTLAILIASMFVIIYASTNNDSYHFDVYPNPMESNATAEAYFCDKIPITITLTDMNDVVVKTIYNDMSVKGQMLIPFNRYTEKGEYIEKGKYLIVLTTNAKYTSTKKLLILK